MPTDDRTMMAYAHSVLNLREAAERYDQVDHFDASERWRHGKRFAGEIALTAASRGDQKSLVRQLGFENDLEFPSIATVGGMHGAPMTEGHAL